MKTLKLGSKMRTIDISTHLQKPDNPLAPLCGSSNGRVTGDTAAVTCERCCIKHLYDTEQIGYDDAMSHLTIKTGMAERAADDLLHPLVKA